MKKKKSRVEYVRKISYSSYLVIWRKLVQAYPPLPSLAQVIQ